MRQMFLGQYLMFEMEIPDLGIHFLGKCGSSTVPVHKNEMSKIKIFDKEILGPTINEIGNTDNKTKKYWSWKYVFERI